MFRETRKFDIDGYHPNIEQVLRTPHIPWAYVAKENLVFDEIPDAPIGRKGNRKPNPKEVWTDIIAKSTSANDMLNNAIQADPQRTVFGFNNILSASKYFFPVTNHTQYTSPPGLRHELTEYPKITTWKDTYFCDYTPADTVVPDTLCEELISETDSIATGESSSVGCASTDTTATSLDALFGEECELSRYDRANNQPLKRLMLRPNQPRPKCLCLIGPTRLGKTLVARSFGRHSYFHGNWNIYQYDDDALYNVFDDIKGQLDGFDFTSFMGAQTDISVTDKYHHKKTYANGKPAIYLSNKDPLMTRKGRENRDWILGNCTIVYVTTPICNLAREAFERQQIDDAIESLMNNQ